LTDRGGSRVMRAMKKLFFPALFGAIVLALAGCSTTRPGLAGLVVELARIEVEGGKAHAVVRLKNPNLIAYNIAQSRHKIELGGWSGVAETRAPFGVPPQSTQEQRVEIGSGRIDQLPNATTDYRLESNLKLRLYGDTMESMEITARGRVVVERK
jgi:hypothetical protein